MKIKNIRKKWGIIVECSINEALEQDNDFWKNLGYQKDLILFKGLGNITDGQYYELMTKFGIPWNKEEYTHSNEIVHECDFNGSKGYFTKFSNKLSKLGSVEMPWHVDIPNFEGKSFPWRCLYNVKNPNPLGGLTSWLNLRLDIIDPTDDELDFYSKITVVNQSWYGKINETIEHSYIKNHPITGVKSLRSNYFVSNKSSPYAWIKEVKVNGIKKDNYEILGKIHKKLSLNKDLIYTHKWNIYDLIIYDNWNLMHRRTGLNISNSDERLFLRTNIHHYK